MPLASLTPGGLRASRVVSADLNRRVTGPSRDVRVVAEPAEHTPRARATAEVNMKRPMREKKQNE